MPWSHIGTIANHDPIECGTAVSDTYNPDTIWSGWNGLHSRTTIVETGLRTVTNARPGSRNPVDCASISTISI